MRRYNIAYFTADWNYELVETTLKGLKQYVDEHENVHLCVFDCFGKDQNTPEDQSEYAIFDLADLSRFDGVLIQGNQIVLKEVRDKLGARVVEAGIPAVSIDCPLPSCTVVGVDNRKAVHDLTEHLIRVHGARTLVHLTGILDNGSDEAAQRRDGFLDACRENGIPDDNVQVFPGTWRPSDGLDLAMHYIREKLPLPDAFVCANDDMALGLMTALIEHGYSVPGDTMVTGFDNLSSAELSSPRLSSVHRDYVRLDYLAMDVLIHKIEGTEARDFVPFDSEPVTSESCGCRETARPSHIRDMYFKQTRFLKEFFVLQHRLSEDLVAANDLSELMDSLERNRAIFGCDSIFMCINDDYYDNFERKNWHHDSETFSDHMVLATCELDLLTRDSSHCYARFPTAQLLPQELMDVERFLIFYPLQYNTFSIGYMVMDSISEAARMNLHESVIRFLEISIENVRKKGLLRHLNASLEDLYVHDALTGLYNRFGYDRFARPVLESYLARDGGAQILFIDMDDMKTINDRFGHEAGDSAIRTTADILRESCQPGDFLMRYGGDEFLVIASCRNTGLEDAIAETAQRRSESGEIPFHIGLSVGSVRISAGETRSLDACVQAADVKMYKRKLRRKAEQ